MKMRSITRIFFRPSCPLFHSIALNDTKYNYTLLCFNKPITLYIHKLTLTVLKVLHAKHKPKIIQYSDFNYFDNASFKVDLLQELSIQIVHPGKFEKYKYISSWVLNTHDPLKENMLHVTNLSSWINNEEKQLWLGLAF